MQRYIPSVLLVVFSLGGCGGSDRSSNLLCDYCTDDSQCGGNPCYQDVSGSRFCGAPCGDGSSCPAGYSCIGMTGTNAAAGAVMTCFPDTESCISTKYDGMGPPPPTFDMAGPGMPSGDMAKNKGGIPVGGLVGPTGGTVDRLFFGITGDTRPDQCGTTYPQQIINNIFSGMAQKGVQFAVDQGDHMFNCGFGGSALAGARAQMQNYVNAAAMLGGKTVFMTMGNHECSQESTSLCSLSSYNSNANYTAFMDVLSPIASKPYYRFDVMTHGGKAAFIVVADDVWDTAEQSWLTQQLTDADSTAKYTFVSKHHPDGNTDKPEFQIIYDLVKQHKYTLFITGHSHLYKRQYNDARAIVMGCGGAPLAGGTFWGYGTVQQGLDDRIYVSIYDQATGNVQDQFDVAPQ